MLLCRILERVALKGRISIKHTVIKLNFRNFTETQFCCVYQSLKKWQFFAEKVYNNSEQALSESMLQGNLMSYAMLKCWFSWSENPQVQQIQIIAPQQNANTIAQKYNFATLAAPPQNDSFSESQNMTQNEKLFSKTV